MIFKRGKVYSRSKTTKFAARDVRCVYSAAGVAVMRNLPGEEEFLEVVHQQNRGALAAYAYVTWENE